MAIALHGNLKKFVQALHSLALKGFPCDDVSTLCQRLMLSEDILKPYIFVKSEHYSRNLIYHDASLELLLLCWGSGHVSPVHGHEGEKCWMRVVQGTLEFTNYIEKSADNLEDLTIASTVVGSEGFVDGPAYIHKVTNVGAGPAMSLHLYARPFAQCDVYDVHEKRKKRIDLAYDTMYGSTHPEQACPSKSRVKQERSREPGIDS